MASDQHAPGGETPPPAYESRPGSVHNYPDPPAASTDRPQFSPDPPPGVPARQMTRDGTGPASATGLGSAGQSSESPHSTQDSTSKRSSSFIKNAARLYKDKRRAKEATRKVDYYQKLYGFVPKNAMTEAEWRDARERMPKTKVPFKARPGSASTFGLGAVSGGS